MRSSRYNVMTKLAVRQLLKNKKRTLITITGVVLSVAMLTAVAGFVVSARDVMRRLFIAARGDYHVAFGPVTEEQTEIILKDPRVESGYNEYLTISIPGSGEPETNGFAEPEAESFREILIVKFRLSDAKRNYLQVTEQIAANYGVIPDILDDNKELLAVEGVVGGDRSLQALMIIGGVLSLIILLGSVIVIANAFNISAGERIQQFGVLKSAGATKEQIRATVLAEGLVLLSVALPFGVLIGFGVEAVALFIANSLTIEVNNLNLGELHFNVIFSWWAVLAAVAVSVVTVFLSAWFPANRAAKISAIDAIRLSTEIGVRSSDVKVTAFIGKLFGFEGTLAAKTLKRSRRKYRATVVSLVVSIVLFVVGSGFGVMINQSAEMIYKDFGVNVIMQSYNISNAEFDRINSGFEELGEELTSSKAIPARADMPEGFLTDEALQYWENEMIVTVDPNYPNVDLIALNDKSFAEVCRIADISPLEFEGGELKGILVNFAILDAAGRRVTFAPFHLDADNTLHLERESTGQNFKLELIGEISDIRAIPVGAAPHAQLARVNAIVPQSRFDALVGESVIPRVYWMATAEDPAAYTEAAWDVFDELAPEGSRPFASNYEETARINQSLNILFSVFILGFVGMLSLIAVTSVLGTISTNIKLRMPEFAMLSSVGMTPEGIRSMLNLESLFYGIKALAIGLPVSLVCYYLLYRGFDLTVGFMFIWPWQSILLSVAAVMLITFATMRYSSKMLKGANTVELIRNINI